ncbi:MAG: GatB/YqeY domain-containing protein [Zoogloeaceae bacterium]|nr:GatB/YqeY domain-containing protein [Zoogloeaceae bacterium]
MTLKERITDDMKSAMRAKESARLGAIRLLLAAIKQKEVDERIELDDTGVLAIVEKLLKQRRDSITQYEAAKREDLASAERFEAELLSAYMPAQLSPDEIAAEVQGAIVATNASGAADMGKVMGVVKSRLAGRADMGEVSRQVKAALSR